MSRRRLIRAVALVACGVGMLVWGASRDARASAGFSATASAYASRVELTVTQAPLVPDVIDAGGPTAQSSLDSLGTTRAVAALPYPGELLLSLPGLANGLAPQAATLLQGLPGTVVGSAPIAIPDEITALLDEAVTSVPFDELTPIFAQAPPLPPYPFAAQANAQQPTASVDLGAGRLDARADTAEAAAVAFVEPGASGVGAVSVRSTSSVTVQDDTVIAEASSRSSGLSIGPVEIGSVQSVARIELAPDGSITPTSSFVVSGVRVGALSADLTADGFSVGGVPVPAPIAQLLTQALTGTGIEFEVLDEQITETGVLSGALRIRYPVSFDGLPPQVEGLGSGEVIVTVGQATATLTGAPIPTFTTPQLLETPPAVEVASPSITPAPPTSSSVGPSIDTPVVAPDAAPAPTEEAAATIPAAASPGLPIEPFDATGIYLVIVAGALLTAGSGELLRLTAFKPRTSTVIATNGGPL